MDRKYRSGYGKMGLLDHYGCQLCRDAIYGGHADDLSRLAINPLGPAFLYRCANCGTYWDYTASLATPISEERAFQLYQFFGWSVGQ